MKRPHYVFDPLVGNHPADKQQVDPVVVERPGLHEVRRAGQVREVGDDRQDGGVAEAEPFELRAVVLRVAQGQLDPRRVGAELAAPEIAQLDEQRMHVDEELGRRDVVVDERHPVGQREGHPRRARANREVMDQQVVGMAGVGQIAVVEREVLEPAIGGLDENL